MASGMLVVMDRRGGGDEERKVADECEKGSSRDHHGSRVIAEKKKSDMYQFETAGHVYMVEKSGCISNLLEVSLAGRPLSLLW